MLYKHMLPLRHAHGKLFAQDRLYLFQERPYRLPRRNLSLTVDLGLLLNNRSCHNNLNHENHKATRGHKCSAIHGSGQEVDFTGARRIVVQYQPRNRRPSERKGL